MQTGNRTAIYTLLMHTMRHSSRWRSDRRRSVGVRLGHELIADPGHSAKDPTLVVVHLLAQAVDVHADVVGLGPIAGSPDVLEDHVVRTHLPDVASQVCQQIELTARQGERGPTHCRHVVHHVDLEGPDLHDRGEWRGLALARRRMTTGHAQSG